MTSADVASTLKKLHEELLSLVVMCKDCPFPMKEAITKAINWIFLSEGGGVYGKGYVDEIAFKYGTVNAILDRDPEASVARNPDVPYPLSQVRAVERLRDSMLSSVMHCVDCPIPMSAALENIIVNTTSEFVRVPVGREAESSSLIATGYGASFNDAFDKAVALLPDRNPAVADGYVVYKIIELGMFRGGIAGQTQSYATVRAVFEKERP